MIVLGTNSDVAQAFIEKILQNQKFATLYLVSSHPNDANKLAKHLEIKYQQQIEVIYFDMLKNMDLTVFDHVHATLLFCAVGLLGENTQENLYDSQNTENIIDANYGKLVHVLNYFAQKFEKQQKGTIIALASVAGVRGRQSNFIYGSAKAGLICYLQGLRNYLYHKNVHVMTVIPGYMNTKMTQNMKLPKLITASPKQAANSIYNAYKNKRNTLYVSKLWKYIMIAIQTIPENVFKKLKL